MAKNPLTCDVTPLNHITQYLPYKHTPHTHTTPPHMPYLFHLQVVFPPLIPLSLFSTPTPLSKTPRFTPIHGSTYQNMKHVLIMYHPFGGIPPSITQLSSRQTRQTSQNGHITNDNQATRCLPSKPEHDDL